MAGTLLPRLLHRGQLQLLVVEVVRLLASVSLAVVSGELLVQVDALGPTGLLLTLAERTSF